MPRLAVFADHDKFPESFIPYRLNQLWICVCVYIYTENYISMEPLYALRLLLKEYWALWVARLSISSKQG